MLDASEALFLRRSDEVPIADQRRGGITVKGVKAKNDHLGILRAPMETLHP